MARATGPPAILRRASPGTEGHRCGQGATLKKSPLTADVRMTGRAPCGCRRGPSGHHSHRAVLQSHGFEEPDQPSPCIGFESTTWIPQRYRWFLLSGAHAQWQLVRSLDFPKCGEDRNVASSWTRTSVLLSRSHAGTRCGSGGLFPPKGSKRTRASEVRSLDRKVRAMLTPSSSHGKKASLWAESFSLGDGRNGR